MKFSGLKCANYMIIAAAVILLTVLALRVRTGAGADSIAVLKTSGMTCGSCSKLISSGLETVKGVAVTEVDVEGGWVIVGYNTKTVNPEILAEKVRKSGFSSAVYAVLTPEQFRQTTGREIGKAAVSGSGCCGGKSGGCNSGKRS
jgi:mercuric ion binding protein